MSSNKFTNVDLMEGYSILNNIKLKSERSKFPYNHFDDKKITFTENVIEMLVENTSIKKKSGKIKKGGNDGINPGIFIYV